MKKTDKSKLKKENKRKKEKEFSKKLYPSLKDLNKSVEKNEKIVINWKLLIGFIVFLVIFIVSPLIGKILLISYAFISFLFALIACLTFFRKDFARKMSFFITTSWFVPLFLILDELTKLFFPKLFKKRKTSISFLKKRFANDLNDLKNIKLNIK